MIGGAAEVAAVFADGRGRVPAIALWAIMTTIAVTFLAVVVALYVARHRRHVLSPAMAARRKKKRFRADAWSVSATRIDAAPGADQDPSRADTVDLDPDDMGPGFEPPKDWGDDDDVGFDPPRGRGGRK